MSAARTAWARGRLAAITPDTPVGEVLGVTAEVLRRVVDFDACALTFTDPATLLPSAATYIEALPAWSCGPYWDAEYLTTDVLGFADLHRAGGQATTLHRATEGRPARSLRHRTIYRPVGMDAELRATFSSAHGCYGMLDLLRGEGAPDFQDDDLAAVDAVRPVVADKLRRSAIHTMPTPQSLSSAMIIVGEDGRIVSLTEQAREVLDLIPEAIAMAGSSSAFLSNAIVHAVWARARFIAAGYDAPEASARIILKDGRRVTLRGTSTREPDGSLGHTVLVLEPTRTSELGLLVVAAHELTAREQQVVSLLLRGDSAQQIARTLRISVHTVRTHVRSIHEKMGVSSRAELTRLFIDEQFLATAEIITH